ncbi:hypothetical protein C7S14_7097 [Burkholderia cepacia]|nr:hypothetical protein C7S14_7097 [Burkholderia cepacia]
MFCMFMNGPCSYDAPSDGAVFDLFRAILQTKYKANLKNDQT